MAVTSNLDGVTPGVEFGNHDLDTGVIKYQSRILVAKLFCLDQRILRKRFCCISNACFQRVLARLDEVLGR